MPYVMYIHTRIVLYDLLFFHLYHFCVFFIIHIWFDLDIYYFD